MAPPQTAQAPPETPDRPDEPSFEADRLPQRDVRAKRPPLLSFVLRMETFRRALRVVSLLALDLAAIYAAIVTALAVKAFVYDDWNRIEVQDTAESYLPLAFLVASLLF